MGVIFAGLFNSRFSRQQFEAACRRIWPRMDDAVYNPAGLFGYSYAAGSLPVANILYALIHVLLFKIFLLCYAIAMPSRKDDARKLEMFASQDTHCCELWNIMTDSR